MKGVYTWSKTSRSGFPLPVHECACLESNTVVDDLVSLKLWSHLDFHDCLIPPRVLLDGSQVPITPLASLAPFRVRLLQLYFVRSLSYCPHLQFLYGCRVYCDPLEVDGGRPLLTFDFSAVGVTKSPSCLSLNNLSLVIDHNTFNNFSNTKQLHLQNNTIRAPSSNLLLNGLNSATHITCQNNTFRKLDSAIPSAVFKFRPRQLSTQLATTERLEEQPTLVLPVVDNFTNLVFLDLQHNRLSGVNSSSLLEQLSSLGSLRTLILSHNEFTEVPNSIFSISSLVRLELSHNHLERVPLSISNLRKLEVLLA